MKYLRFIILCIDEPRHWDQRIDRIIRISLFTVPLPVVMPSIRHFSVIMLLCGMVTFGHLPAWMHMAECTHSIIEVADQVKLDGTDSELRSSSCSDSCCGVAAGLSHENQKSTDPTGSEGNHEHHEDSCFICQSLGVPNGFSSPSLGVTFSEYVSELSLRLISQIDESESAGLPDSRGPPSPLLLS